MIDRKKEWQDFSNKVLEHIINYTEPQYLQNETDTAESFTLEQIKSNLQRYISRMGSNARGRNESIRDLLKIAHYSAILHGKYEKNQI